MYMKQKTYTGDIKQNQNLENSIFSLNSGKQK